MPTFDREDLLFQLYDVAKVGRLFETERFSHVDKAVVENVLASAEKLAADYYEPAARKADEIEPEISDGKVVMIPEAQAAVDAFREAGFMGMGFKSEVGGVDMPESVVQMAFYVLATANVAYTGYGLLTTAAGRLLAKFANQSQKEWYLLRMVEGRFFGTMCLSEPHAGSSLADISATATPRSDGSYDIRANKMWTSCGDHELSENIVHLVLAKIPGGPPGVKGISLFIVPKYRLDADGAPFETNDVELVGLNHKMGYRGITNCAMSFGANGHCVGELVGEPHRGLQYMFQMMNEARIFVGVGATALGQAGFQVSLQYARERPQGRSPGQRDATSNPIPIIEHADVRRLLLAQKAAVEPSLALGLYCAGLVDIARSSSDSQKVRDAQLLLEMLTPIIKSWPSEFCLEANKHALQVLGGAGYTRDYPVERYYRDNRLNPIHEGTHGIQGIDFLGRKTRMLDGAGIEILIARIRATIDQAVGQPYANWAQQLQDVLSRFEQLVPRLVAQLERDAEAGLADATLFLDLSGHIVMAWMHLRILEAAEKLEGREDFVSGKRQSAKYFFSRELPRTKLWAQILRDGESSPLDMQSSWY